MFHRFRTYPSQPDLPRSFGWKNRWMAVKDRSVDEICPVLGLMRPKPANWEAGLAKCDLRFPGRYVFLTPDLDGWTLILNLSVYRGSLTRQFLADASERLDTEVACFGNLPSVEFAMWAFASKGIVERLYLRSDGVTYFDEGDPSPEERKLHAIPVRCDGAEDSGVEFFPSTGTVFELARARVINPMDIESLFQTPGCGWIAKRTE